MPVISYMRVENRNAPEGIPMGWLSNEMALANHGQSLELLKDRGGMSCAEIWANIHSKNLTQLPSESEAIEYLNDRISKYYLSMDSHVYGAAIQICQAYSARGNKSKEEVIAAVLLNVHLLESGQNVYKKVIIAFEDTGFDPKKIIEESANKKS